jgi:hypothetical protein
MKWTIKKSALRDNLLQSMRSCQYRYQHTNDCQQHSFARTFYNHQPFPRFHLYIDEETDQYIFNLHLDQKKASYKDQTAHSADYDDDEPLLKSEFARITSLLN